MVQENSRENGDCLVYACVNQKGGVGKSVTSTNLGIGLARRGQKVLIVDLDSQASQTVSLGWKQWKRMFVWRRLRYVTAAAFLISAALP